MCVPSLPENRIFSPFSRGPEQHPGNSRKTDEKGLFPQISSDLLKPPSLEPLNPHGGGALQKVFLTLRKEQGTNESLAAKGGQAKGAGQLSWGICRYNLLALDTSLFARILSTFGHFFLLSLASPCPESKNTHHHSGKPSFVFFFQGLRVSMVYTLLSGPMAYTPFFLDFPGKRYATYFFLLL